MKNNLSRYLARVREGAEFTVLDRDTPVARLIPFAPRMAAGASNVRDARHERDAARAHLTELQRLGILGTGDPDTLAELARTRAPIALPAGTASAVDLLIQMRRESSR